MPTNKPEVVLPELPAHTGTIRIYAAGGGDELATVAAYTADQMRAYGQACIETLTRPANGDAAVTVSCLAAELPALIHEPHGFSPDYAGGWNDAMRRVYEVTGIKYSLWEMHNGRAPWPAPSGALSAAPQQHGQEVVDALPWGWKWLTCSAAHRADAVANIRQMAEDVGAYDEPAGIIPAPTQAQLLASIADALEADSLFERNESSLAQQPAEVVAWIAEKTDRSSFPGKVITWRDAFLTYPADAEADGYRITPLYLTPPPAIDIGKLRDAQDVIEGIKTLADGWRDLAAHIRETDKHSPVANELDNCADDVVGTIEAALIGDGGEKA